MSLQWPDNLQVPEMIEGIQNAVKINLHCTVKLIYSVNTNILTQAWKNGPVVTFLQNVIPLLPAHSAALLK